MMRQNYVFKGATKAVERVFFQGGLSERQGKNVPRMPTTQKTNTYKARSCVKQDIEARHEETYC